MPGLSTKIARAGITAMVTGALVLAAGCGGGSSDSDSSSETTTSSAGAASSGSEFSKDVVAACSTFKTDSLSAGIDVADQIAATETFKASLEDVSDPSEAEAALLTWTGARLDWLDKVESDPKTAGNPPVSVGITSCGVAKAPDNADGCDEFDDAWDSLVASVQTETAAAQVEANILLAKSPPADVVTAIGVLVTASDGLPGDERSLDAGAARETVRTWAKSVC